MKYTLLFICSLVIFSRFIFSAEPVLQYRSPVSPGLNMIGLDALQEQTSPVLSENLTSYYFQIHYADPIKLKGQLALLYPESRFVSDDRNRIITGLIPTHRYNDVKRTIERLDQKVGRIHFEVQIVELSAENLSIYRSLLSDISAGISANYDFNNNKVTALNNIQGTIAKWVSSGKAKLLAKPSVLTMDNQQSKIQIGDRIPYTTTIFHTTSSTRQVQYLDTGILLDITPTIASETDVIADIRTEISSVKQWRTFEDNQFPVISTRKADVTLRLEHNQPLLIAGLWDEQVRQNESGIPFLKDIPFIGGFFKSSSEDSVQNDIIFLITPKITSVF